MAMQSAGQDWVNARLERWQSGRDADALGELLKWQRTRAYATALRILGNEPDAEDAVQQANLKMLSRSLGFESAQAFRAAVYRAVVQCALDLVRARKTRGVKEKIMRNAMPPPVASPLGQAEHAEALRLLQEELGALDAEERALVTLCVQEGMNLSEAAAALDTPRETARDRLADTLTRLRERLRRRGVALPLLLLLGLIHQGQAHAASAQLCLAMDASLAGAPCAHIAAASAVPLNSTTLLAEAALLSTGLLSLKAGAAALLLCALGGLTAWQVGMRSSDGAQPALEQAAASIPQVARETQAPVHETFPPLPRKPEASAPVAKAVKLTAEMDLAEETAKQAAIRALPGLQVTKVEKEMHAQTVVYEVEGRLGEKRYDVVVSTAGKVLEIKEDPEDEEDEDRSAARPLPPPADEF